LLFGTPLAADAGFHNTGKQMGASGKSFQLFKVSRRADLRRIARGSCGDYTEDDVGNEAWLIAHAIDRKRGYPVNFSNDADQELVLSWLYNKLVKFSEKNVRYAVRLDRDWDSDDSEYAGSFLEKLLATPDQLDPLFLVQAAQEEDSDSVLGLIRYSYSQCAAYLILLNRFEWDIEVLADHLRVVVSTVNTRLTAAGIHLKHQPSLFDRISVIFCLRSVARVWLSSKSKGRAPGCSIARLTGTRMCFPRLRI